MDKNLFAKLERLSYAEVLPSHEYLFSLSDRTATVLENEITVYRPAGKNGKAGGLLDFTLQKNLPLVLVPDLHARSYFVRNIMNFILPEGFLDFPCAETKTGTQNPESSGISVFEALEKKLLRVVCVGDLLHSELRGKIRWLEAEAEFEKGIADGLAMKSEMKEGLCLLSQIMELKCAFPENFHILKGNHENILNETGNGNFSFRKFCNEGEMCRSFMEHVYGDEVTYVVSCFEKSLPLLAAFPSCVVSHAEPKKAYSRDEIICGLSDGEIIKGLTWTENGAARQGSVEKILSAFCESFRSSAPREVLRGKENLHSARYFAGHRPVRGKYALRQNGFFVQFHNPEKQNIALVYKDKIFNPDEDIVSVAPL